MGADVAFLGFIRRIVEPRQEESAELGQAGRQMDASVRGIEENLSLVQASLDRIEAKLGAFAG